MHKRGLERSWRALLVSKNEPGVKKKSVCYFSEGALCGYGTALVERLLISLSALKAFSSVGRLSQVLLPSVKADFLTEPHWDVGM